MKLSEDQIIGLEQKHNVYIDRETMQFNIGGGYDAEYGWEALPAEWTDRYQVAFKTQTCTIFRCSALFAKPSAEEVETRTAEDWDEDSIELAYELCDTSPDDGKMTLSGDWSYWEGTIEELTELAESRINTTRTGGNGIYDINLGQAVLDAIEDAAL